LFISPQGNHISMWTHKTGTDELSLNIPAAPRAMPADYRDYDHSLKLEEGN